MFRKLIESITTLSGSARGDAKNLAGRIAKRCATAFELSGDDVFRTMGSQALAAREVVEDMQRCTDEQARVTLKALISIEKEVVQLAIARGLRGKVAGDSKADSSYSVAERTATGKFVVRGMSEKLSPQQYGWCSVNWSVGIANATIKTLVGMPHVNDNTSLIHQIVGDPNPARRQLIAIGAATHVLYVDLHIPIAKQFQAEIGNGIRDGIKSLVIADDQSISDVDAARMFELTTAYFKAMHFDFNVGTIHCLGTEVQQLFIKNTSRYYAREEDIDDYEGMDSITIRPVIQDLPTGIMTGIREILALSFQP